MQLFGNQGDRSPSRGLLLVRLWLPKPENLVLLYLATPRLSSFHPTVLKSNGARHFIV
jgi:hypothetical protein